MTTARRLLSLVIVVALTGPGVLAPLAAVAQSQMQAAQPDLYGEALKAAQPGERKHQAAYEAGAAVASVFTFPGRFITCSLGGALGIVTLALTFGSGYGAAKSIVEEGCVGKWVVTPDDLRAENERTGLRMDPYLR